MAEVASPKEERQDFARAMAHALHQEALAHNAHIPFEDAFLSGVEWFERRLRVHFEDRSEELRKEGRPVEASQVAIVAAECGAYVFNRLAAEFCATRTSKQIGTE